MLNLRQLAIAKQLNATWPAWLVLVISLMGTIWAWRHTEWVVYQQTQNNFDQQVAAVDSLIHERLREYRALLLGVSGLFAVSGEVSRQEWQAYVQHLKIETNYPSLISVNFARYIPSSEKYKLIQQLRNEGAASFNVFPTGQRQEYLPVIYTSPLDSIDRQALGKDLLAEPLRHAAAFQARDNGQFAITGQINLLQKNGHSGFIMFVPVYRFGMPTNTVIQRRQALIGFIYSPVLMNEFMADIISEKRLSVGIEAFDGSSVSQHSRFDGLGPPRTGAIFNALFPVQIAGHTWTVHTYSLPNLETEQYKWLPFGALILGICISSLLFCFTLSLITTRNRALDLAHEMTLDLRRNEARLRQLSRHLQKVREEERKRIACEIHDELVVHHPNTFG